jgi:hypothetical protein
MDSNFCSGIAAYLRARSARCLSNAGIGERGLSLYWVPSGPGSLVRLAAERLWLFGHHLAVTALGAKANLGLRHM